MQKLQGYVEKGNTLVTAGGFPSPTKVQGSFPGATITIYNGGTVNPASIYSDNGITPKANPFVSDVNGSWFAYAANGRYDVQFSGTGVPAPFTLGDFLLFDESIIWIDVTASPFFADKTGTLDSSASLVAAFAAALAISGSRAIIYLPPGQYKISSNLIYSITGSTPKSVVVYGPGATLVPTAAVTTALTLATESSSDGYTSFIKVSGLKIDGDATDGATGVLVGENVGDTSAGITLEDVMVTMFDGAGSKGINIRNVVNARFVRTYVGRCGTNLYIKGDDVGNSLPTTLLFENCQFREARSSNGGAGRGLDLVRGYRASFRHCLFEANEKEGVYCAPGSILDNCLWIEFDDCWIEGNQVNGTVNDYDMHFDGTNAGTVMVRIANTNFNSACRSIFLSRVSNSILDNIYPRATANSVVITNLSRGCILNWPENNITYATAVNNTAADVFGFISYAPGLFYNGITVQGVAAFSNVLMITDAVVGNAGATRNLNLQTGDSPTSAGALRDYQSNNVLSWDKDRVSMERRFCLSGGTVAAANDLTLPSTGNVFVVTGNTQINAIISANWGMGPIILKFAGTPTVKHNTAGGAGTSPILLNGSVDLVAANNTVLSLVHDGANWQEISRKVP